jgi:hypothetical protein
MTINVIDRTTLGILAKEINDAVQAVADKHGVAIKTGRGVYGMTSGSLKLEIATKTEAGDVLTKERSDFMRHEYLIEPLTKDDLDRTFDDNGRTYRIVGLRTKARKNNIETLRDDGKVYVWPARAVKARLDREAGA